MRIADLQDLLAGFDVQADVAPRYNVAPAQAMLIALNIEHGPVVTPARWGMIAPWAEDPSMGSRMISARAETVIHPAATHVTWIDGGPRRSQGPVSLLVASAGRFGSAPVSKAVNNPKHGAPDCVEPAG